MTLMLKYIVKQSIGVLGFLENCVEVSVFWRSELTCARSDEEADVSGDTLRPKICFFQLFWVWAEIEASEPNRLEQKCHKWRKLS